MIPGLLAMLRRGAMALWVVVVLLAGVALPLAASDARAQDVLPVPALDARVVDQTGTLGPAREALEKKLADVEQSTGSQIVILMVPTTQPEDIASYAYRVADTWKIGRRDVGDGVLVVVAKDDRHVRIEVARALEGAIPDLAAYQIIDRTMRPAFKTGDFAGGLSTGVDQLAARLRGENLPPPEVRRGMNGARAAAGHGRHGGAPNFLFLLFGVFVAASILKAILGRTLGSLATGAGTGAIAWMFGTGLALAGVAGVVALLVSALTGRGTSGLGPSLGGRGRGMFWAGGLGGLGGGGFGRGGGGFGGGGGGGFSSGGGGSFGGGGASGNW